MSWQVCHGKNEMNRCVLQRNEVLVSGPRATASATTAEDKLGVHEMGNHNEVAVAESTKAFPLPNRRVRQCARPTKGTKSLVDPARVCTVHSDSLHSAKNIMTTPPRLYPAAKQLDDQVPQEPLPSSLTEAQSLTVAVDVHIIDHVLHLASTTGRASTAASCKRDHADPKGAAALPPATFLHKLTCRSFILHRSDAFIKSPVHGRPESTQGDAVNAHGSLMGHPFLQQALGPRHQFLLGRRAATAKGSQNSR